MMMNEELETQQLDIREILAEDLMEILSDEELSQIGTKCKKFFDEDYASNKEWRTEVEEIRKMAAQVTEPKTSPWPNASNIKYPLITTAALQFNARAYPVILNNSNIALVKVLGSDNVPQQMPDGTTVMMPAGKQERADRVSRFMNFQLTEDMDDWDADTDQLLLSLPIDGIGFKKTYWADDKPVSEFVNALDVVVNSYTKSLRTAPAISHIFSLYPYEIMERDWREGDFLKEEQTDPEDFIEQYSRHDLDGDGYPEPYIVTFHKDSGYVVKIEPNFTEADVMLDAEDEIVKIKAGEFFTAYHFLPDPEGKFYSRGFGQLLKPINDTVDSILNQLIDAGTLANAGGGFIAKGFRLKSGQIKVEAGKWHKVDVGGMDMRGAIMPYPIKEPSGTLFSLLGLLLDAGKDIASIQDVMTGAAGQNTPATTVLSMIEQGMKVYTAIFRRVYRSERQELIKLYRLNKRYLSDEKYMEVLDEPAWVGDDFEEKMMNIVPAADPNMATDMQKAAKAQVLMEYIQFPFINAQKVVEDSMEASGISNVEDYFVPPPTEPSIEDQIKLAELELKKQQEDRKDIDQERKNVESAYKNADVLASALEKIANTDEKGADNMLNAQELDALMELGNEKIRQGRI